MFRLITGVVTACVVINLYVNIRHYMFSNGDSSKVCKDNYTFGDAENFSPEDCEHEALVIIPVRDHKDCTTRSNMAKVLVKVLSGYFRRTKQCFHILLAEQTHGAPFNRGAMFDAGFMYGVKRWPSVDYVLLHDVDEIPIGNTVPYEFPEKPTCLLRRRSKADFQLMYKGYCGGVVSMQRKDFEKINGFCISMWGWGAEDDDLANRIKSEFGDLHYADIDDGTFWSLHHNAEHVSEPHYKNNVEILRRKHIHSKNDGIGGLNFKVENVSDHRETGSTQIIVKLEDTRSQKLKDIGAD